LLQSLQPALARPQEASALFIDHVAMALAAHLLATYGGRAGSGATPRMGNLSRHQLQRCLDLIEDSLDSDISLASLAQICNVSSRHLTRLFVRSLGQPPYRYLLSRRIARAKLLLQQHRLTLCEVAQICGFADQSHFTRAFTSTTGLSPGAFRREIA
jgi:transcriptional regulator GlxA family with amidase domain